MPDPTEAQYGAAVPQIETKLGGPPGSSVGGAPHESLTPTAQQPVLAPSGGGGLPFTGFDAGALLMVAVALTGVGVLLRRLVRHE